MEKVHEPIVSFIKAIDNEYFNAFMTKGEVCMNTVDHFRTVENGDGNIGDKFELSSFVIGKGFVSFGDPFEPNLSDEEIEKNCNDTNWSEPLPAQDFIARDANSNGNIYSLFAILKKSIKNGEPVFLAPEKFVSEFSNHRFVLFLKPNEIISSIKNEIVKIGKKPLYGLVEYYPLNEEPQSNLCFIDKPDKYRYQIEYRIYFDDDNAVQRIFSLGPMNEYCIEVDLRKKYIVELHDDQFSIKPCVD